MICRKFCLINIILILLACAGFSQNNALNSLFSIQAEDKSIYSVLQDLSNQSGIYFTYSTDIIYEDSTVNVNFQNKPLQEILEALFSRETYVFQLVDEHIIISRQKDGAPSESIEIEPFITIEGQIYDKFTRKPLHFATVSIYRKEVGTIANTDGSFILKVPWEYQMDSIAFSFVGYETVFLSIKDLEGRKNDIFLKRKYIPIDEVTIRTVQPLTLLRMALEKVDENYATDQVILNAFYREAVKKSNDYVLYSEALIDINKTAYTNHFLNDQVRLKKSRKIIDYGNIDTVLLKLKAGVNSALLLDFVKNPISFVNPDYFIKYQYRLTDITNYNKKLVYVIEFDQFYYVNEPFYEGKIFIDVHSLALLGAEFSINKSRINKAATLFVVKKTNKVDVRPVYARYKVEYKEFNGKYYLNYARGDLKLKVKNKDKLFATSFETFIELAVSEIDTTNTKRFRNRELMRTRDIFVDNVSPFDTEFWEDYNYIPPEESIEDAIKRIQEKLQE